MKRFYFKRYGTWDEVGRLYRLCRLYWLVKQEHEIYASASLALTPKLFRFRNPSYECELVFCCLRFLYHRPLSAGRPA